MVCSLVDYDKVLWELRLGRHSIDDAAVAVEDAADELLLVQRVWPHGSAVGDWVC